MAHFFNSVGVCAVVETYVFEFVNSCSPLICPASAVHTQVVSSVISMPNKLLSDTCYLRGGPALMGPELMP